MPFKSDKQRKYLFAKKPEVAKKLAKKYAYGGTVAAGESVAGTSSDGTENRHVFKEGGMADYLDKEKMKKFKFGQRDKEKKKEANIEEWQDWVDGKGPKPEGKYPTGKKDGGVVKSKNFSKIDGMLNKYKDGGVVKNYKKDYKQSDSHVHEMPNGELTGPGMKKKKK